MSTVFITRFHLLVTFSGALALSLEHTAATLLLEKNHYGHRHRAWDQLGSFNPSNNKNKLLTGL